MRTSESSPPVSLFELVLRVLESLFLLIYENKRCDKKEAIITMPTMAQETTESSVAKE